MYNIHTYILVLVLVIIILVDIIIHVHVVHVVMYDMYRYIEIHVSIFSFNIVIQYWLLGVSIHWNGQFSKSGFFDLSNFIPKSNCIKLVIAHFLTNTINQLLFQIS